MEAISGTPTGGDPSVTAEEGGAPPSSISETRLDGHVTIVEVEIDADGHAHGEVVELDADGHIVHVETVDVQLDGEVTVVEVDVEHDGGESVDHDGGELAHHDEVALHAPSAPSEGHPSDTGELAADGETEWVFDTDDYVPSTTPGDDWSPDE